MALESAVEIKLMLLYQPRQPVLGRTGTPTLAKSLCGSKKHEHSREVNIEAAASVREGAEIEIGLPEVGMVVLKINTSCMLVARPYPKAHCQTTLDEKRVSQNWIANYSCRSESFGCESH
uniref:Uncharacterized protein n=1 Tax=Steinernema glaseri TaxID=37863 RepID=A0A1I7XY87_9BILA